MSKQTLVVVALATTISTIGLLPLCGCRASMAVRDSEMPQAAVGAVSGEYVLEKFVAQDCGIGEAELRTALQKDSALQAVFKGRAEDKDALPVTITVERTTKDVNGGIATVNNLVALCTLSLWPCVDSKELEYTLTASSIVGTHTTSFKVMNRSWFGLSPVAMLPVPGFGDIRGDENAIKQFHVAQIIDAAKALCAELPKDYAAFKKEQPKYLEEISQAHTEASFAAFRAAKEAKDKVDALAKVVNAAVIAKHQDEFVAAFKAESDKAVRTAIWAKLNDDSFAKHQDELVALFKAESDKAVRAAIWAKLTNDSFAKHQDELIAVFKAEPDKAVRTAILAKLNDSSFDKLPYDPMLISHWTKLGDSQLLARVYRDGYDKLSEADRKSVIAKITDDVVLTEMVTPPSRDELRAAQRKSKEKMREKLKLGERKLDEMNREELREEMRREAESALDKGLYVKNSEARAALYGKVRPDVLATLFSGKSLIGQVSKENRTTLRGAYGCVYEDVKPEVAKELLSAVNDQEALFQMAVGADLFSIRCAAIERLSDDARLEKIAVDEMRNCPYDTSLKEMGWGSGLTWITESQEASIGRLKKLAISRMKDAVALKQVRKASPEVSIKKAVSERLSALGFSEVDEIIACDKYDKDLFSMFAELKKTDELAKVSKEANLKGVRLLAASKLDAETFLAVAKKELAANEGTPVEGKLVVSGFYLGMGIEEMFAKVAAEYPDVKPTIYLDDKALCIAGGDERDIAWADAQDLDVHWMVLPPSIVKQIVGFKTGSFEDLKRAVEKKLGVSFGYDIIRKGSVSQKIGNLENTEGETLRYFVSEIGEGEDFSRTVRKAVNSNSIGSNPLDASVAGLSNAIEDAMQADENRANAKSPRFQPPGSLQLLMTKNAAKGTLNSKGSFLK